MPRKRPISLHSDWPILVGFFVRSAVVRYTTAIVISRHGGQTVAEACTVISGRHTAHRALAHRPRRSGSGAEPSRQGLECHHAAALAVEFARCGGARELPSLSGARQTFSWCRACPLREAPR